MSMARTWLTALGLLLLAGGLLAAPCSALASCCAATQTGGSTPEVHITAPATDDQSGAPHGNKGSCGAAERDETPTGPFCLERDCLELIEGTLPALDERRLVETHGGDIPSSGPGSGSLVAPVHGIDLQTVHDGIRRALFELNCVLLI